LLTLAWTNVTGGSGGTGRFESVQGGTSGWWRTPPIALIAGVQTCRVWAVDVSNEVSATNTQLITYNTSGLPADPANYPTGAVFATQLQVNRQVPPAFLGDINPKYSWFPGDALNNGAPEALTRLNLGAPVADWHYAAAIGDLTGDGRPDIVIINQSGQARVLVNNGSSPTSWPSVNLGQTGFSFAHAVAIGDLNLDARPDVVLGISGGQNVVYMNNGSSPDTWLESSLGSALTDYTESVAIGDVTGDGLPDVVVGNDQDTGSGFINPIDFVLVNNGGDPAGWPRIPLGSPTNDYTMSVALADLTGDGRPDVVVGNRGGDDAGYQNYLLVNTGGSPSNWPRYNLGNQPICAKSVAVGDVTGDGRPDVVTAGDGFNYVAINDGGNPTNWVCESIGPPVVFEPDQYSRSIALGDINGDGLLDVVIGNKEHNQSGPVAGGQSWVAVNTGASPSNWPLVNLGGPWSNVTYFVAAGDVTGDGRPDVVVVNGANYGTTNEQCYVLVNNSTSMPYAQAGYRIQVAASTNDLAGGNLLWDSGLVQSATIGDGATAVRQASACTNAGEYYWRGKVFSASGYQGDWTPPRPYVIPTNQVIISVLWPPPPLAYVTGTPCAVAGWISWNATNLAWSNITAGGSGSAVVSGSWTQTLALAPGSNTVRFVAQAAGGLAATQTMAIVYATNLPGLEITTPNSGQSFTTAQFSVQLAGTLRPPLELLGSAVYLSNAASGVLGVLSRTNGQSVWPEVDPTAVALRPNTNNLISVWCETRYGVPVADSLLVGCFASAGPSIAIRDPNGGANAVVYTNQVILAGTAQGSGGVSSVGWTNMTAGTGGVVACGWVTGQTSGSWRTPTVGLAGGTNAFYVWAVDNWSQTSAVATIAIAWNTNGAPTNPADFAVGGTYAGLRQINRQWPPAVISDTTPKFSWQFGDAFNTGSPTNLSRTNLGNPHSNQITCVAVGDLDGDGRPEIVEGNYNQPNYVWLNPGGSPTNWIRVALGSVVTNSTYSVALGDVTGDGLPDVVVGNHGQQNHVMINSGGSPTNWARVNLGSALADATLGVAIGDVTGDGRPDVVVGNDAQTNYVLVNNGGSPSNWARVNLGSALNDVTYSVAIGDVTGDGRPDVVVGNSGSYGGQNYVLVNNGGSPASWARVNLGPALDDTTCSVAIGDLTGDELPDVVVGNYGYNDFFGWVCGEDYVLVNNGGSPNTWSRVNLGSALSDCTTSVAIGDLNGDGRPDVVVGNQGPAGEQNYALVNDGRSPAYWARVPLGPAAADPTTSLAVNDLNGDGRPDVVVGNYNTQPVVLTNHPGVMPYAQQAWQIQVARTTNAFDGGSLLWDSGISNSAQIGDGVAAIRQLTASVNAGSHYWRARVFSDRGQQSGWTEPVAYNLVGNGVPAVRITNAPAWVTYDTSFVTVQGTNNLNVLGLMGWSNSLNGLGAAFAADSPWRITNVSLAVGTNPISVVGTNLWNQAATDTVVVVRGDVGTGTPVVDITSGAATVTYDVTHCALDGTNNIHVLGRLRWTNSLTGSGGTALAISPWYIEAIDLGVGTNLLSVSASNALGVTATDSVAILRGGLGTGQPTVAITNAHGAVTTAVGALGFTLSGTNNLHVTGTMGWTNSRGGEATFGAVTPWAVQLTGLSAGTNVIAVWGTNALGISASDTVNVIVPSQPPTNTIAPPANVVASAGTHRDKVLVSWAAVTNATAYEVWRAADGSRRKSVSGEERGKANPSRASPSPWTRSWSGATRLAETVNTFYDDTTASRGMLYAYYVKAKNAAVTSALSVVASGWRQSAAGGLVVDYDGDSKADPALYDEATGTWWVWLSGSDYARLALPGFLGGPGYVPVSADYDGDRLADPGVYGEAGGDWLVLLSAMHYERLELPGLLGGMGFSPAPGDFDGDRLADPGVYGEIGGDWLVRLSTAGYAELRLTALGGWGYGPVPADFDGDGKADPALYQEANGDWVILLSSAGYQAPLCLPNLLGGPGWLPMPADYDGDGKADPAVRCEATSEWRVLMSGSNYTLVTATLGL
jgi:hypothetical protein